VIAGGNAGGTITFNLYSPNPDGSPADCTAVPPFYTESQDWTADGPYTTNNCITGFPCKISTAEGQWNWQVIYHDSFNTVTGNCGHEHFVIKNDNQCPTPVPGARSKPLR
jgi:hypothetical protein